MLQPPKKLMYEAFGFRISSDIPLPELSPSVNQEDNPVDIEVVIDNTPKPFDQPPYEFVVEKDVIMVEMPDTAIFSILEGKRIVCTPRSGADEALIRLYILGTCMGSLLLQRRILPLHGSAVAIGGKAYAFIGDSGAGKSTLASAFMSRGYQLLSDDVIAVSFSGGVPLVIPSYPQQKLWQDSLNSFGMEISQYLSIFGRETKYSVPVSAKFHSSPLPLAGVFELVKGDGEQIGIEPVHKLERLQMLFVHTYRSFLIPRMELMEWHFNTSASLANRIELFRLRRNMDGFSAPQLASIILDAINSDGGINYD
ncbi:HPr kinase/phosphorylase [Ferviditalea candida]|uniref:Aldolase n=1 Tax=Ferviditalea candida TaxID=3108399 RepID=A0ABU5ZE45_9BACL|nr:aldolase [Paenibacillaceae bacterium T2]